MNIDSIIFDLDGTLWDSSDVVLKSWNMGLSEYKELNKQITKEELQGVMGMQIPQIGATFFPDIDIEVQTEIMEKCCTIECDLIRKEGGNLYRNLEETLKILSEKYKLIIVSNCQSGYIEAFLDYHCLEKYFIDIECAGNTGLSKGENIKKVMKKNMIEKAIYVGDTQGDCNASKLAEIPFVFASYGFGKVDSYDYIIEEIADILNVINDV